MKSKRFVALLLSLVMVFTLIGCGTQTPPMRPVTARPAPTTKKRS